MKLKAILFTFFTINILFLVGAWLRFALRFSQRKAATSATGNYSPDRLQYIDKFVTLNGTVEHLKLYPSVFQRLRNKHNVIQYDMNNIIQEDLMKTKEQQQQQQQRSKYQRRNHRSDPFSVAFAAQASMNRLFRIKSLINYEIPTMAQQANISTSQIHLSIVVYTQHVERDWHTLYESIVNHIEVCNNEQHRDWCTHNLDIHMVTKEQFLPYPINFLRNVSIRFCRAQWIMLYDIDFILGRYIVADLLKAATSMYRAQKRNMYIVPAFEYYFKRRLPPLLSSYGIQSETDYQIPRTKRELLKGVKRGIIDMFHVWWPNGHAATRYKTWYSIGDSSSGSDSGSSDGKPYRIGHQKHYEPYVFFPRIKYEEHYAHRNGALCDERFYNRGYNKVQCYDEMVYRMRLTPYVLPNSYLIHFYENKKHGELKRSFLQKMEGGEALYNRVLTQLKRLRSATTAAATQQKQSQG